MCQNLSTIFVSFCVAIAAWSDWGNVALALLITLNGVSASISICDEDFLPWTNLQALNFGDQRPDLYLSLSSHWFLPKAQAHRQVACAQSWARLFGVSTLRATNY